jgi:ferredoxin
MPIRLLIHIRGEPMKGKPGKTIKTGFGDEAGVPVIDVKLCTKCGLCVKVCKSFTIIDVDGRPVVVPDNELGCIACGQCMMVCPKGAVTVSGRKVTPSNAFLLPPKNKRATPEMLENLLVSRRSVREFSKKDVNKKLIDKMLAMSTSAPMGIPPSDVSVAVVYGRNRVQELAGDIITVFNKWQKFFNPVVMALMRPFMKKAAFESFRDFILPVTNFMIDSRKEKIDYLFYDAPVVLLFHQSPYADPVDGHIACTYAMIAAESLGLGTCMIGTVAFALEREKEMKKKWGMPPENAVSLAMILGYLAFRYAKGIKRSFASVVYK